VQLQHPHRDVRDVGHHVIIAQERAQGTEHVGRLRVARLHHVVEGALGRIVPMPGVLERLDLRLAGLAGRRTKQDVVGRVRIEWRIQIDEVHALVANALAQHVEIVAVIEVIRHARPLPPAAFYPP
jgi:hypothetical protein